MSRRRLAAGGAAVVFLAAVLVAGVVAARDTGSARSVATASGPVIRLAGTEPITGARVDLAQFADKPVVVNVWASWCAGCNEEAADLVRLRRPRMAALASGALLVVFGVLVASGQLGQVVTA